MKKYLITVVLSLIYAVVRYVAFAPQNAVNIPVFVANKAVGVAAAITLVMALWARGSGRVEEAKALFRCVVFSVIIHVPMSLTLLGPVYFPEFYQANGRMHLSGEVLICCGAIALALVWYIGNARLSDRTRERLGWWLLIVLGSHVSAMGAARGLNLNAKHAYLPPMWLLSVLAIVVGIVAPLIRKRPVSDTSKDPADESSKVCGREIRNH